MGRLVSVIMPYYNAAATLRLALASLRAQTYAHWECVIVDDGSDEPPEEIVKQAGDDRVTLIRLDRNQGRGHARQVALDCASGAFLSMLDADDWVYPEKLERQVKLLDEHPEAAFVSGGMAIVNAANEIMAVRCRGRGREPSGPLLRPAPAVVAYPPSMIRMELARSLAYDCGLSTSEDFDFLMRLMLGHRFLVDDSVCYAYFETATASLTKELRSLRNTRLIFARYWNRFPLSVAHQIAVTFAKQALYRAAFAAGQERYLFRRRSRPPTPDEAAEFQRARSTVDALLVEVFGQVAQAQTVEK